MSLRKENLEKFKIRATDRIKQWIEDVKSAGVTRLQDRYGEVFKRIEWKKDEEEITENSKTRKRGEKKKKKHKSDQQQSPDKGDAQEGDEIYDRLPKTPDRSKSRNRSRRTPEIRNRKTPDSRCRSRMTPDSWRREATSATDHRHNISSHNRSSRGQPTSLCSVEAISLLCDDESANDNISLLRNYYKDKNSKADILVVDPEWIHKTREKERNAYQNLTGEKKEAAGSKLKVTQKRNILDSNLLTSRQRRLKNLRKEKREKALKRNESKDSEESFGQQPTFVVNVENGQLTSTKPTAAKGTLHGFAPPILMSAEPSHQMLGDPVRSMVGGKRTASSIAVGTPGSSVQSLARPVVSVARVPSSLGGTSLGLEVVEMVRRQRSERRLAARKSQMGVALAKKEAPKEIKKPGKKRQHLLRRYIRKIMIVQTLLRMTQRKVNVDMRAERRFQKRTKPPAGKEHLTFDPNYYKAATTTYGGLSLSARTVLWKQPGHRTEEDVHILMEVMYRLPFFTKYSRSVKEELARVMWYDEFENGRVIIRQGDPGSRMYFIVSGGAAVQRTEIDPRTNTKIVQHLRDLNPGATFGELALLRNISRTFTVVCKGMSGFLSLSKNEFNNVLRKDYEESWNERFDFFKASKHLKRLNEEQLKHCTDMSETRSYSHNKLIHGDVPGLTQVVYFIKSGNCLLVKKVEMIRSQSPYLRPNLYLPEMDKVDAENFMNKPYGRRMRRIATETHYLTVLTLNPGDYFGIGEDLTDLFIIAKGKVECILLNAIIFGLNWQENERLKQEREKSIPSNIELYRRYEQNRRWLEYKKDVVEGVMKRHKKRPNSTWYKDVPEPLVLQPTIPYNLIHYEK